MDLEGSPLRIQSHTFSCTLRKVPAHPAPVTHTHTYIMLTPNPSLPLSSLHGGEVEKVREDGQSLLTINHSPCLLELTSCPFPPDLLQEGALPLGRLTRQRICSKQRAPLTLKCSSWPLVLRTSSSHFWYRDPNLSQYTDLSSCL